MLRKHQEATTMPTKRITAGPLCLSACFLDFCNARLSRDYLIG
jgi:hypothetical protein